MEHYGRRAIDKRIPIDDNVLWTFLGDKAPSQNIPKIIEVAERSGVIRRVPGINVGSPRWIPRPLTEHTNI
jgi:hypothetical protein